MPHRQSCEALIARARYAQAQVERFSQASIDQLTRAAAWAILEPERNRALAELAVAAAGGGNVEDRVANTHRLTLGVMRDLADAQTVGSVRDDVASGVTEVFRPLGVIAAQLDDTATAATAINLIVNALKGGNAIILAPAAATWSTCATLVEYIYAEFAKLDAPYDLVQVLPQELAEVGAQALMERADCAIAVGSRADVQRALTSGVPTFSATRTGAISVVDDCASIVAAARHIARSITFDNASTGNSERALIVLDGVYQDLMDALGVLGGVRLTESEVSVLNAALTEAKAAGGVWRGISAADIAQRAGIARAPHTAFFLIEEGAVSPEQCRLASAGIPVANVSRAKTFGTAMQCAHALTAQYGCQSLCYHGETDAHALLLARELPIARVIVNQPHAIAVTGDWENALPFSTALGAGSWCGNRSTDNLNWRHFINVTRIARPIAPRVAKVEDIFSPYWQVVGR